MPKASELPAQSPATVAALREVLGLAIPFDGLKLLAIGDSITDATNYAGTADEITEPYHELLQTRLGFASVYKRGIGGSAIQKRGGGLDDYLPLCDAARIAALPADADVILIYMGVNDIGYPLGAGVLEQDEFTLSGALNSAFSQLCTKYAGKPIIFFGPLGYGGMAGTAPINVPGLTAPPNTSQIADMIATVCRQWAIPFTPLNHVIRYWNATDKAAFMPDGIHPNNAGHAKLAAVMEPAMRTLA